MKENGVLAVIQFRLEDFSKIMSIEDFYKKIGVYEYIKSRQITNIEQIHMLRSECELLLDIMQSSQKRKDEHTKFSVSMDWLNYSPVSHVSFNAGEIVILESGINWREFFEQEGENI